MLIMKELVNTGISASFSKAYPSEVRTEIRSHNSLVVLNMECAESEGILMKV